MPLTCMFAVMIRHGFLKSGLVCTLVHTETAWILHNTRQLIQYMAKTHTRQLIQYMAN